MQHRDCKCEPFAFKPADGVPHPSSVFPQYYQGKLQPPPSSNRDTGPGYKETSVALPSVSGGKPKEVRRFLPSFIEENGRRGFIWKVLILVLLQLFMTIFASTAAICIHPIKVNIRH